MDVQAKMSEKFNEIRAFRSELRTYYTTLFSIGCVFMALGTVENILVCCVLSKGRIGRATTKLSNFFILQLAITDLMFRAVSIIRRTTNKKNMEYSPVHCQVAIFSQFTCAAVTFVLLTGIAIDRYIHILFPLRSLTINTRKYLILLSMWLYSMLICSGLIASATVSPHGNIKFYRQRYPHLRSLRLNSTRNDTGSFSYKPVRKFCIPGASGSFERKVAFTIYFLFAFVLPLLLIIFTYTRITVFLWKRTKTNNRMNSSIIAKAKLRAIQMFILVVLSFLISWGPIMILDMLASYPPKKGKITFRKFPLRPLFDCVSLTSSIFNPFIYAFGDANFRRSLRLCCHRRKGCAKLTRVSPGMNGTAIQMTNLTPRVLRKIAE